MKRWSVIVPWKNRAELGRTLLANAALLARHAADVVVVNCGGDPEGLNALVATAAVPNLRQVDLSGADFNWSLAANIGVFCSSGEYVFLLDTDIILVSDVFSQAESLLKDSPCFVMVRKVRETQPRVDWVFGSLFEERISTFELISCDGRKASLRTFAGNDGSRCGPGLILVKRDHFLAVGGCNSALGGWGFYDMDLHVRLQLVLNLLPEATGDVLHLSHGDETRDLRGRTRMASEQANQRICFENYCLGRMTGTYEVDRTTWRHRLRVLDPCLVDAVRTPGG